jgi:two-component system response regulator HydG
VSKQLRILIVDDDRRMARTLQDILKVKGHLAEGVYSGPEAVDKINAGHFDCILTDIKMPEMNGVELYQDIKATQPGLPVVLMTAYATDKLVEDGLKEGAIATLTKPLDIDLLLRFFSALREERAIVIVDDDTRFCKILGDILQVRGFTVTQITDPHSVMEKLRQDGQTVLLDMKLNDVNGLDIFKKIREEYPHLPVILMTGYMKEMSAVIEAALKIGACTCLYKPFEIEELIQILIEISHEELRKILAEPAGIRKRNI